MNTTDRFRLVGGECEARVSLLVLTGDRPLREVLAELQKALHKVPGVELFTVDWIRDQDAVLALDESRGEYSEKPRQDGG